MFALPVRPGSSIIVTSTSIPNHYLAQDTNDDAEVVAAGQGCSVESAIYDYFCNCVDNDENYESSGPEWEAFVLS